MTWYYRSVLPPPGGLWNRNVNLLLGQACFAADAICEIYPTIESRKSGRSRMISDEPSFKELCEFCIFAVGSLADVDRMHNGMTWMDLRHRLLIWNNDFGVRNGELDVHLSDPILGGLWKMIFSYLVRMAQVITQGTSSFLSFRSHGTQTTNMTISSWTGGYSYVRRKSSAATGWTLSRRRLFRQ